MIVKVNVLLHYVEREVISCDDVGGGHATSAKALAGSRQNILIPAGG